MIHAGSHTAVLSLQPGFVEGIVHDKRSFGTIESAYRHIFRNNRELAILLWNNIPVALNYREDLPAMAEALTAMLRNLQKTPIAPPQQIFLSGSDVEATWTVRSESGIVSVNAAWFRVPGGYEQALNDTGVIWMARDEFLSEWKLLFEQLTRAVADSGAVFTTRRANKQLEMMRQAVAAIAHRGRFYRYEPYDQPERRSG
jgi:hypothetical protein